MPARNSRKVYQANSYYHIYNRGVDRQPIFQSQQDYRQFQTYLREYLSPKDINQLRQELANPTLSFAEKESLLGQIRMNNYSDEIDLLAYCLMTNHFHFLVKQSTENAIDSFMNSLATRYSMYFNRKYRRVGHLYQGVYKAVSIESEAQLLELTRYIHNQAIHNGAMTSHPSSLPIYLGEQKPEWVKPTDVLAYFSKTNPRLTYRSFLVQENDNPPAQNLTIEEN